MSSARNRHPWRRLNVRLALWHSVLFLASVLTVLVLAHYALSERVEQQDKDVVLFRLNQFSSEYTRGGMAGVVNLAAWRKGRAQRAFFVRIADAQNRTLYIRDADDWDDFFPQQLEARPIAEAKAVSWIRLQSDEGYGLLLAQTRLPDGAVLQVGKATEESQDLLTQFRRVSLLIMGVCIPLSFLGGAFLASRALAPLRALARTVREIEQTARFSARTPESGTGDELDELARVFNAAMARIERLLQTMRESLDNVAHDLRTPMTRLQNRAQACLQTSMEPAALQDALAECVEESQTVLQMLDTLMDISEAEAGLARISAKPVNAAELVDSVCDLYREVAEEKQIAIESDVAKGLAVRGDPVLLRRVLANLLDNAIKYTSENGRVKFTAERRQGDVALNISDTGIGIAEQDLPKVWERLFRADRSRSQRGLGLGLSFVKAIVEAHGGSVLTRSEPGAGSVFTVVLPAADAA